MPLINVAPSQWRKMSSATATEKYSHLTHLSGHGFILLNRDLQEANPATVKSA